MKFVFASYVISRNFKDPKAWLKRIRAYIGVLESLSANHDVSSIEQIDYVGEYPQNGVKYYFKRLSRFKRRFPWQMHRFIVDQNPDVIFIQGLHFPWQVIQLGLVKSSKTKLILQHHSGKPCTGFKKYLQKIADRYVDAYLFASHDMGLDWVKRGNVASADKIYEVMEISSVFYPIEKALARSKTRVTGEPVFLWVGRLNQNKDPLCVIRAFLKYAVVNTGARLYMLYHTEELLADIKLLLNNHPNGTAVTLIGKRDNDELFYWYNSADFILSGSHDEVAGTAVCEAMSCGCIPIVTDIFSFRMMTDGGQCGALYPAGDEQALLNILLQVKDMDIKAKQEAVLNFYQANLSFEAIAKRIAIIAESL